MSHVCLVGYPSCLAKTLYRKTMQPNLFIPARLIGTIDFCHLTPFSLTLTFAGITRSAQTKSLGLIFFHTFQLIRMKFVVVM